MKNITWRQLKREQKRAEKRLKIQRSGDLLKRWLIASIILLGFSTAVVFLFFGLIVE